MCRSVMIRSAIKYLNAPLHTIHNLLESLCNVQYLKFESPPETSKLNIQYDEDIFQPRKMQTDF